MVHPAIPIERYGIISCSSSDKGRRNFQKQGQQVYNTNLLPLFIAIK